MMKEIDRTAEKTISNITLPSDTFRSVRHGGFVPWDMMRILIALRRLLMLIEVIDNEIDSEIYYFRYQIRERLQYYYAHLKRLDHIYQRGRVGF
jgi:hypothetical protein